MDNLELARAVIAAAEAAPRRVTGMWLAAETLRQSGFSVNMLTYGGKPNGWDVRYTNGRPVKDIRDKARRILGLTSKEYLGLYPGTHGLTTAAAPGLFYESADKALDRFRALVTTGGWPEGWAINAKSWM